MWVTIIADASYCPQTRVAGYGFWISSQRGKRGGDGVIGMVVTNNIAAEIMALLNAFHVAHKASLILENDCVLLQTDCQPAISALKGNRTNISEQELELVKWFEEFVKEHKLHIRMKHVKGHSGKEDARYVVNKICDRKARRNMRQARELFNTKRIRKNQ